jgi:hypothetical protein
MYFVNYRPICACFVLALVAVAITGCQTAAPPATTPAPAAAERTDGLLAGLTRSALLTTLAEALEQPGMEVVCDRRPVRAEPANGAEPTVTFYVRDYAIDVPRGLIERLHNPWLFRSGGGWRLAGNCRLTVHVTEELGLAEEFREAGLAEAALATNDEASACRAFAYPNDFELLRAAYTTDFGSLDVAEIGTAELACVVTLAEVKSIVIRPRRVDRMALLVTPNFHAIAYGDIAREPMAWVDVHDSGRHLIRFTFGCPGWWEADATAVAPRVLSMAASTRYHNSPTPGADMLAAARRVLSSGKDERSMEIARSLVLCASRYDDAYDEAVAMGKSLASSDKTGSAAYLGVISRAGERR